MIHVGVVKYDDYVKSGRVKLGRWKVRRRGRWKDLWD